MVLKSNPNSKLNQIIGIAEKLEGSKLDASVLNEIEEKITPVSEFLGVDKTCAIFFSLIFVLENQTSNAVTLHDIAEFLDYSFIHILEFRSCLSELEDANLITLKDRKNVSPHAENNGYVIHGSVINNVIDGTEIQKINIEKNTTETVLSEINFIQGSYIEGVMKAPEYIRQIIDFESKHMDIPLVANLCEMYKDDVDSRLLMYAVSASRILGNEEEQMSRRGDDHCSVYDCLPHSSVYKRRRSFRDGSDILMKDNLLKLVYEKTRSGFSRSQFNRVVKITNDGLKKLLGDEAEKFIDEEREETEIELVMSSLYEIGCAYETRRSYNVKVSELKEMEKELINFDFFKNVKKIIKDDSYRFILYDMMSDYIDGGESSVCVTLSDLYGKTSRYFSELRSIIDDKHYLVENGFIEVEKNKNVEKATMTLSDRSIELLYGKDADIFLRSGKTKDVIEPQDLKEKKLFYSAEVQKQIDMLESSLTEENIVEMQKRLDAKGLCKGIACILYGAPGTGKTETAYQLAKKTNRKIMHVDISESKSMWFGESEKLIKKIFTRYNSLCKNAKRRGENMPILLFNEADALISKRKEIGRGGCDQTENAIQNILLEEMEKLEGIMIATTNLCENMDKAFERRFLFKVKYEKPTMEARENIWKSKIDFLSDEDISKLAAEFDFSGGEIDNVVRKCEMNEIITGKTPVFDEIVDLCKTERLSKAGECRIGF